jgi:hypothetical protein
MADVQVMWQTQATPFPEGTPAEDHYVVHLGGLMTNVPLGMTQHTFIAVPPGDYPSSVDLVAVDGSVLGSATGNTVHVPQMVTVQMPMNVMASVL